MVVAEMSNVSSDGNFCTMGKALAQLAVIFFLVDSGPPALIGSGCQYTCDAVSLWSRLKEA